jgi:hypothetical protein
MWNWLTRGELRPDSPRAPRPALSLESLESREVPAILVQLDYSLDTGFFKNNPAARAVMQEVATELGNSISANLAALVPSGTNTWTASFFNPATGGVVNLPNVVVGANSIKVYVGARALGSNEAGVGGYGGYGISGTQAWVNRVQSRGWSGFAPWGGSIAFDTTKNWYFGLDAGGLQSNQVDFYSVATHELGHLLGIGTAPRWKALSSGGTFHGASAMAVYGGAVPESPEGAHWADGITVNGHAVSLDPVLNYGTRVGWSSLDAAALHDLGWVTAASVVSPPPVSPPPPPPPPPPPMFTPVPLGHSQPVAMAGTGDGVVRFYTEVNGTLTPTGQQFIPFPGYRGVIRVAAGDFNGDGAQDYAFTVGAGPQAVVEILDGSDGSLMLRPTVLFPGFRGGLFIAAGDIDHDGKAELAISADAGAYPIVQTFHVSGGALHLQSSFFAFNAPLYRGGIRIAVGDINNDGFADLVAATGAGVKGAAAVYSGAALRSGTPTVLYGPFAPFVGYRGGLNPAVGDLNGDGYADLVFAPDRGAPGHIKVWSGAEVLSAGSAREVDPVASFYAFPATNLGGARPVVRDADGDGRPDLVVVSGNPANPMTRILSYDQAVAGGAEAPITYALGTARTLGGVYAGDHVAAYLPPSTDDDLPFSHVPVA